jgi:helicase
MNNLYMRRSDVGIEERAVELEDKVLVPYHERASFEEYCSEVKTAMLLHDWIEEKTNEQLYERYGAYSGDVNYRVQDTRWLLQAAKDLARLFNDDVERPVHKLSLRVRHGAKNELLPLLELEGLGRYRARQLYKHGFQDKADLKDADAKQLVNIRGLGPKIVERVKRQLGEDVGDMHEPDREQPEMEGQMHLGHYDE